MRWAKMKLLAAVFVGTVALAGATTVAVSQDRGPGGAEAPKAGAPAAAEPDPEWNGAVPPSASTIRAAVLHEPGEVRVEDVVLDPPGAGEVLVRVAAAGVCHSDVHLADGSLGEGRWPMVLANVYGPVLIEAAPQIARAVEPGGTLIISGILREQADDVLAAFRAQGLSVERIVRKGKWVTALTRAATRHLRASKSRTPKITKAAPKTRSSQRVKPAEPKRRAPRSSHPAVMPRTPSDSEPGAAEHPAAPRRAAESGAESGGDVPPARPMRRRGRGGNADGAQKNQPPAKPGSGENRERPVWRRGSRRRK